MSFIAKAFLNINLGLLRFCVNERQKEANTYKPTYAEQTEVNGVERCGVPICFCYINTKPATKDTANQKNHRNRHAYYMAKEQLSVFLFAF